MTLLRPGWNPISLIRVLTILYCGQQFVTIRLASHHSFQPSSFLVPPKPVDEFTRKYPNKSREKVQNSKTNNHRESAERTIEVETNNSGSDEIITPQPPRLDFAILGHAKCGTSTMMTWLSQHPEVLCFPNEVTTLQQGDPDAFAEELQQLLSENNDTNKIKTCYKSPSDVESRPALRILRTVWPDTKLIVGIRHPIRWFESFYNFRIQNFGVMPHPNILIGQCQTKEYLSVCTDRGRFHLSLARLMKTNYANDTEEQKCFSEREWSTLSESPFRNMSNPVFLYDTSQLSDGTRANNFRRDLQQYLGLNYELSTVPHFTPGMKLNETEQSLRNSRKIDICHEEYDTLRLELVQIGRRASLWIRRYFLQHPSVTVSSRDQLIEILKSYGKDPCTSTNTTRTVSTF